MQKREFFKSTGAGLLAMLGLNVLGEVKPKMPAPVVSSEVVPATIGQLEVWFAANFNCVEGQPKGWYYLDGLDHDTPKYKYGAEWFAKHPRQFYSLFGLTTANDQTAEARLVGRVHAEFKALLAEFGYKPKLVWRRLPRIEVGVITDFGPQVATREDAEDPMDDSYDRKYIPAESHRFNSITDTWHEWAEDRSVMRLRMRLALEGQHDPHTENCGGISPYADMSCRQDEGMASTAI